MRVGFLYFHHIHHLYHSLSIAFELSTLSENLSVELLVTSNKIEKMIGSLDSFFPEHSCRIQRLKPPVNYTYFNFRRKKYPLPRVMMKNHADYLNQFDVLVGTSFETERLFRQLNVNNPKYIFAFHGIGVRDYGYQSSLKEYNHLLLPGGKIKSQLDSEGFIKQNNWSIIGYPKFDFLPLIQQSSKRLFDNKKPIVLYNPHWNHHVSSWFPWGKKILKYFAKSKEYNLIFAPHPLLKEWKRRCLTLGKYDKMPNIHIDLGSVNSVNLTYTTLADIYLGDVSSQVFEFIHKPKPCLFLNAHKLERTKSRDFPQWDFGPVLENISMLSTSLSNAINTHSDYITSQETFFNEAINLTETPSGRRGADAIKRFYEMK